MSKLCSDETPKKQSEVTSFFTAPLKSERITQAIADMIVSNYVPLSIVEGEGLKNLMSIVAPYYTVLCRKTVRSCIQRRNDVEREALMSQFENVSSVSIDHYGYLDLQLYREFHHRH
ncbi:hypothetical protein DPMN_011317 [Dreissena polymorpha]|uniref:Uncharacterized protein n=1 Tax=Dreissena polymorpha TaxID=45954 RepID=A0A9D4N3E0_DREPO|nr:hypothetical protein DPMN_011317 [Dreissena polymorpha]